MNRTLYIIPHMLEAIFKSKFAETRAQKNMKNSNRLSHAV